MFHRNGSRHNKSNYCYVSSDENDACFTAVEAGITISIYCNVSGDENDASITAMEARITISFTAMVEAGITKVATATYPVMKMTHASLQWKRE